MTSDYTTKLQSSRQCGTGTKTEIQATGTRQKAQHLNITQFIAIAMGGDFDKVIGARAHSVPIDSVIGELKEVEK